MDNSISGTFIFINLIYLIISNLIICIYFYKTKLFTEFIFIFIIYNNFLFFSLLFYLTGFYQGIFILFSIFVIIHIHLFYQIIKYKLKPDYSGILHNIISREITLQELTADIKIAFVIPVKNQSIELENILSKIPNEISGYKTIVVIIDNASNDSSQLIASKYNAVFISSSTRLKGTHSYALAIEYLKYGNIEFVFLLHPLFTPEKNNWEILLAHLLMNSAEIICGYYNEDKNNIRKILYLFTLEKYYYPYAFVCLRISHIYKHFNPEVGNYFIILLIKFIKNRKKILQVYLGEKNEYKKFRQSILTILSLWINL